MTPSQPDACGLGLDKPDYMACQKAEEALRFPLAGVLSNPNPGSDQATGHAVLQKRDFYRTAFDCFRRGEIIDSDAADF